MITTMFLPTTLGIAVTGATMLLAALGLVAATATKPRR